MPGQRPPLSGATRLRSQLLPFAVAGMEVCDADGDGQNEVFLLEERKLHAYRFTNNNMEKLAEYALPVQQSALVLRSIDLYNTRRPLLVVVSQSNGDPVSRLFSFNGKQFTEEAVTNKYYLNVVSLAPHYKPELIGQASQAPQLFLSGVHQMEIKGKNVVPTGKLALPAGCNVYNFTPVPPGRDPKDAAKYLMATDADQLRVYSERGARIAQTEEQYSSGTQSIAVSPSMPGMGIDTIQPDRQYYIPLRALVADLAYTGVQQIIVGKPVSTASQFFLHYREFPQSEIHSLYWDGVGLNLLWKTRRIKGSLIDFTIADLNNDGIPDLTLCLITYTGAASMSARRSQVLAFPLDLSKADPNTARDRSEDRVQ